MKNFLPLMLILLLFSCSNADLAEENKVLKAQVEQLKQEAERQAELAVEAAAMARAAQVEAERQAELAREQTMRAEEALANWQEALANCN